MQKSMVQKMALVGLLVALEIVLSRFLSISTFNLKIGLYLLFISNIFLVR